MATSAKIKQSINQSATVTQTGGSVTSGTSTQSFSATVDQTGTNTNSGSVTVTSGGTPPPITEAFRFGLLADPSINPATGFMWDGSGNSADNFNISDASNGVETGLAVKVRGGATYTPTHNGINGEQIYLVQGGAQPGAPTRADFNIDYDVNTAAGIAPNDNFDLANAPGLAAYNFQMTITQQGPNFAHATSETYALNAGTHVWTNIANGADTFGGDDFPATTPPLVQSHLAENSINFGFANFVNDFGPLATSVAPGAQYDVKITGSAAGATPVPFIQTHDLISVHG